MSLNDAKNAGHFFILFFNELESGNEYRVKMHVIVHRIFIAVTHRGNGNGYRCMFVQTASSMYLLCTYSHEITNTYVRREDECQVARQLFHARMTVADRLKKKKKKKIRDRHSALCVLLAIGTYYGRRGGEKKNKK